MWGYGYGYVGQAAPPINLPGAQPGSPAGGGPATAPAGGMPGGGFINPNVLPPQEPASPVMAIALAAALAGGGALVGWLWLHSQKAAIIGGGLGLAAGAASSLMKQETWKGST
jgi:hypothetical protein